MYVTTDKILTKQILRDNDLPTPSRWTADEILKGTIIPDTPIIIKPVAEDASVGIDASCVVRSQDMVRDRLSTKQAQCQIDFFCEAFVEGRECNISMVEINGKPFVCPPAEILFTDYEQRGQEKIVCYDAKRDTGSFAYHHTDRTFDRSEADDMLIAKLYAIAYRVWDAFGIRGYARVDMRIDQDNNPFILEVNANPCISPDAGLFAAWQRTGRNYDELVNTIIQSASPIPDLQRE
jgi:D-alanine-D-alanine ligase